MVSPLSHQIKLLIVDDDAVDRMALQRVLKKTKLDVLVNEAVDAESALATIDQAEFDCLFLDYNLPGEDGLALTHKIRARGIKAPLIVLTGQGDEQTAVELMKAGASDYLPKSKLSAETISRIIRSAMRVYLAESIVEKTNHDLRQKNILLEQQNRELEQQRQQICKQNLQLQEVSRLKSEFLATMSHELRTPLNAIIGFSQILTSRSKDTLSEAQKNMVSRILANGRNLLELINDILAFSKLEAGRLELQPAELDLAELVTETTEELRSLSDQKALTLEVALTLSDPRITNDATRLRQILVNLLSNAIKFTDSGTVRVQVEERKTAIVMSISDTGCGISAHEQLSIFDPFHQVDQKATRHHPGTGLGLAITHSLVKMMNGDMVVSSEENVGTTFRVEIPRTVAVQLDPAPGKPTHQKPVGSKCS
ncbi:MAG: ATP-binding protein [Cyanobacteria bacterium J06598_1]